MASINKIETVRNPSITPILQLRDLLVNLFRGRNFHWVDFDFFHFGFEYGSYKGKYIEVTFVVFGLGFFIEWYDALSRSVFTADLDQKMEACKDAIEILNLTDPNFNENDED